MDRAENVRDLYQGSSAPVRVAARPFSIVSGPEDWGFLFGGAVHTPLKENIPGVPFVILSYIFPTGRYVEFNPARNEPAIAVSLKDSEGGALGGRFNVTLTLPTGGRYLHLYEGALRAVEPATSPPPASITIVDSVVSGSVINAQGSPAPTEPPTRWTKYAVASPGDRLEIRVLSDRRLDPSRSEIRLDATEYRQP